MCCRATLHSKASHINVAGMAPLRTTSTSALCLSGLLALDIIHPSDSTSHSRAFIHSRSTPTCRCTLARHSATRSIRQTSLNWAGHILCKCHIAFRSMVGYRQCHQLRYHRFHTHTRHGTLEKQTAMLALMGNVVEFLIFALVNMHSVTKLASHDLVHPLTLYAMLSLKH